MSLILSPVGDVISMYMEDNDITVADVATEANVSLKTVYRIIKGETPLNAKVAIAIENLIPGVDASYLMSYDSKYNLEKAKLAKSLGIKNVKETINRFKMDKLYPGIKDESELIEKCKQIYGDSFFDNDSPSLSLNSSLLNLNFSIAKNEDRDAVIAWINVAFYEYVNSIEELLTFNDVEFDKYFKILKKFSAATSKELTDFNIREFCKRTGINFYCRPKITNSRVRGLCFKDRDDHVYIFMSDLFRSIENDWLTFVHECIHIKNGDYNRVSMDTDKKEFLVDEEVIEFFLNEHVKDLNNQDITLDELKSISNKTKTPIGIACAIYAGKTGKYGEVNEYIHRY